MYSVSGHFLLLHLTYQFNAHFVLKNEGMNLTLVKSNGFSFEMLFKPMERIYCGTTLDLS